MNAATTTHDERAIRKQHADFAAAWSRGDAAALIEFFAEDSIRVGARGDMQHGRKEIAAAFERLLNGPFAGARVELSEGTVRFLGRDVALWQGRMEIVPGGDRATLRGYSVDVMIRVGSKWLILETHPKLFPTPPTSAHGSLR